MQGHNEVASLGDEGYLPGTQEVNEVFRRGCCDNKACLNSRSHANFILDRNRTRGTVSLVHLTGNNVLAIMALCQEVSYKAAQWLEAKEVVSKATKGEAEANTKPCGIGNLQIAVRRKK